MRDPEIDNLFQECAGMRLVLVHFLARRSKKELADISASIDAEFRIFDIAGLQGERAIAPYRAAADGIIADAVKRAKSKA